MSYSRADGGDFADHVREHYEKDGHQVFVDFYDIKAGADWSESIRDSIAQSDFVAIIVTRSSLKSTEVEKEVLEARRQNKTIIPCRYRGIAWTELKWDLNKLQGFQFDNKNSLIRQLDDIIFGDSDKPDIPSLPEDEAVKKAGWRDMFSRKRSKRIIAAITVSSIIAIAAVVIGMGLPQSPTPEDNVNVDALFSAAVSSYKTGQYSDAVDSFDKVLQMEPNNVTAQFLKGSSLYNETKYEDAVDSFDKVLGIKSDDINALLYKGLSLYNLKRYNEAIAQFNRLLAINPQDTDALLYKGLSLYNLERYNEAIAQFNRLLAINPQDTDALLYKGLSLYNLERYSDAVAYYDMILKIDPNNINATKEKERTTQQIQQNQSNVNS